MPCQARGAPPATCRCHECYDLLFMARWTDNHLEEYGEYPQELDIPQEVSHMETPSNTGFSNTRTPGSGPGLSYQAGGSSVPQESKRAPPSAKCTERTTSRVIFTPPSSHHADSRHSPKQQSRFHGIVSGREASQPGTTQNFKDYTMVEYLKGSDQPWSPHNMRST
ncbi:hypothetical protein BKA81DRAFT_380922 [Phyllosticta paracitricarpa]